MAIYLSRKKGSGGGGNLQSNKTITATTSQQIVQPDSGYDGLEQVTVNPQEHTQTYTPADDTASNDMGVNNNYRYVDTSGMVTPTSITPSNASPAALTSGSAVNPTANGYAIASYNTVMPSGVPTSVSSGDIVKISGGFNSVIVDKDYMHDIKGSNTSPERLYGGSLAKIWGNDPTVVTGYAIASYTPITPSSTPTSISQGDMVQVNGSGVIVTPTSATPSDSTPPQLSQGGIYIPTSNGYLYENQQGGSTETVLWTNNSPTSSQSNGQITLSDNISNYEYLALKWRLGTSDDTTNTIFIKTTDLSTKGVSGSKNVAPSLYAYTGSGNAKARPIAYVDDTTLYIGGSQNVGATGATNGYAILLEVKGISVALPPSVGNVKVGYVQLSTSASTTVNLGWHPKYISLLITKTNGVGATTVYNEDALGTSYVAVAGDGSSLSRASLPNSNNYRIGSVSDTGFTINKVTSGYTDAYYFALG